MTEATITPDSQQGLQRQGQSLMTALYATLQAIKLYPLQNDTVQAAIDQLHTVTQRLLDDEGKIEFRAVAGGFLLNQVRIRLNVSGHAVFGSFERALAHHEIGTFEIDDDIGRLELPEFMRLLLERPGTGDRFERFQKRLRDTGLRNLTVGRRAAAGGNGKGQQEKIQYAAQAYVRSVQVARDVLVGVRLGKAVNARSVKRAVQGIVDQVLNNEVALLGMTTLRDFDEYTFTHSVNVCILSVVLGQRLGLDKRQLYDLGLCGLLHDIGKARIDAAIINKPGKLTEEEWHQMKLHPREGLLALFELRGFTDLPYRQMLAAYEHHMRVDFSGYPRVHRTRRVTLFTRVVSVVDTFDAVSSARSYRSRGWPPDKVLLNMRDEPGWGLDRVLVKAFITATGIYPVGTVVSLSDNSLAIVVAPNADSPEAPVVQLLTGSDGQPLSEPVRVDLADPADSRRIRRSMDPTR